ncbi:M14 family metallopeptidase [Dokdonella sp.]|uniref:M14 family metallopeptidase n=1 Tax=Dokdonella sp. TaxID=2291710 RepID=UPI001B24ACC6|nr:M14 family metallopeptidase [Dokdonella sp.]MBO9663627.1 peptidase M14 [Dokdonella sp.]
MRIPAPLRHFPLLCLLFGWVPATSADWTTPAERAEFATTPSYAQTRAYLERLAASAPERIRLTRFGVSPEGRDLMLVVAAKDGEFTPEAARASGKEIVLVQSGIHAGEIEGKDAALMLLRDLRAGAKHARLLDHAILVWLPIFNVDGHENAHPYNRINQNGPREMGFRATAQNLNLNRDYIKADAPEMRDWLAMFDAWQPDLFFDIHTTDGADYQYDLTWYLEEWGPLHPAVKRWQSEAFARSILPDFEKRGHLAAPYLELVDHRDLGKGIANFGSGARFSTGYVALRNRAAMLVETHMLKPYATRVRATYDLIVATLAHLDRHPGDLRKAVTQADADTVARVRDAQASLPVAFRTSDRSEPFTLKGYAFEHEASAISGDRWVRYDPRTPKTYTIPFFRDLVATETVRLPAAYLVPASWPQIADKLRQHGIRFERVEQPLHLRIERYRLDAPRWDEKPFESRHWLRDFASSTETADADFAAGAILIPLDQPAANVAVNLLEPRAADSLLHWGFFDTIFEQKEYADARVAERLAREMLAKDPALKSEFEAKLAADAAFAKSPAARLAFFYERSPWYAMQKIGAYPVVRLDAAALAKARAPR